MGSTYCIFVLPAVLLFFPLPSYCAHPLSIDDTGTIKKGNYEFEAGYERTIGGTMPEFHKAGNQISGISLVSGITDKMDLGIAFPYYIEPQTPERFGSAAIKFKFSLIKDIFSFSISNELGHLSYFLNGIFSREMLRSMFHFNLGYSASGDIQTAGSVFWGCAFEYPVKNFTAVGEFSGDKSGFRDWLAGVRYSPGGAFSIDLAYGGAPENERLITGFHFEWGE
jgi:hypothetical protein